MYILKLNGQRKFCELEVHTNICSCRNAWSGLKSDHSFSLGNTGCEWVDPTEQMRAKKNKMFWALKENFSDDHLGQRLSEAGDVSCCLRNPKLLFKITSHFSKPEPKPREKHIHINAFMSSILKGKRGRKGEEKRVVRNSMPREDFTFFSHSYI